MKRLILILVCVCILLAACKKSTDENINEPHTEDTGAIKNRDEASDGKAGTADNSTGEADGSGGDGIAATLLKLNASWANVKALELEQAAFTMPAYTANAKPYKIADDLSNVANIDRFKGLSNEQKKQLAKNGFIVLPARHLKSYYVYDNNEYQNIPSFITSDVALHLYHQFYDRSLMAMEMKYFYEDLDMMTAQMLDKSILLYEKLQDEDMKELQRKNIVYFLVARMLFTQQTELKPELDEDIRKLAMREFELAQKAAGIEKSPLFGHDLDYSQFIVRGHYTRSEQLGRFFKAMMWFGLAPLDFGDPDSDIRYDNVYQALLIAYMTVADSEGECDAKLWSDIYEPTAAYVGLSDDINVFTMNGLRLAVYGNEESPDSYNDENYLDKLTRAVKDLPRPRIQGRLENYSITTGLQFRFMGQRYNLDAEILQNLMKPILRPVPSALDVMGVLGSDTAEKLLLEEYKPQNVWPEYTDNYNKLKSMVASYDKSYWQSNLYSGWLWSLQSVLKEYDSGSGMPYFMTTEAWRYKSLNAALGSYTELKHDTVLYGKQAVAEMGGPLELEVWHYVEPNIELYAKLKYLTEYTYSVLEQKGLMGDSIREGAQEYIEFLQLLINCSIKELRNEPLTEEENRRLLWAGGTIETIGLYFIKDLETAEYATVNDPTDMLVTDIATSEGIPLCLGTGYFDEIYVVIPHEDKLYLARGCVYSFYEFLSDKRLTDEEWWKLQGITVEQSEYGDYIYMDEPSEKLPQQPDWTARFKSESNQVTVKEIEVDWSALVE